MDSPVETVPWWHFSALGASYIVSERKMERLSIWKRVSSQKAYRSGLLVHAKLVWESISTFPDVLCVVCRYMQPKIYEKGRVFTITREVFINVVIIRFRTRRYEEQRSWFSEFSWRYVWLFAFDLTEPSGLVSCIFFIMIPWFPEEE